MRYYFPLKLGQPQSQFLIRMYKAAQPYKLIYYHHADLNCAFAV